MPKAQAEGILWEEGEGKNVIVYVRSITNNRGADVCVEAVGFQRSPRQTALDNIPYLTQASACAFKKSFH